MAMSARFGEILAEARKAKRITLRKLGDFVGLSPSFLSEMERGGRRPPENSQKIRDLAIILNLDPDQLSELAAKERARLNPKLVEKLFEADPDLAWGLCRATEDASETDLKEGLKQFLKVLERGDIKVE
jgi:transcriptional regulator with XRE-family HTH domain